MKNTFAKLILSSMALSLGIFCPPPALAGPRLDAEGLKDKILQEKCALCHDAHRVYEIEPSELLDVMERMKKKNPDWFTDLEGDHIVEVVSKVLADSRVVSAREAREKSLERGERYFGDAGLGTSGSSCATCHGMEEMRRVSQEYPSYDMESGRMMSLGERIHLMIVGKMKGESLDPFDPKVIDLEVYLKSLR